MYLSHFGLNEPPFRITPNTEFFFDGANRGATLDALLYAIQHDEGIIKVTGEVGSGKTMLCRVLLERLPPEIETIYLATPSLSRDEILKALCDDLQINARGKRTTLLLRTLQNHLIERYAEGKRVVVLIDEAHAMPNETLEEIRLLSNLESNRHKLLQIVLFGQPELEDHLATISMRQLKERITHSFQLEPMVRSDIDSYVDFRMRAAGYRGRDAFSPVALKIISKASEGLTRRINILSDKSLLAAFADSSHEVSAKHAKAAVADSDFDSIVGRGLWPMLDRRWPRRNRRWQWAALGALGGLIIGLATAYLSLQPKSILVGRADPIPNAGAVGAPPLPSIAVSPVTASAFPAAAPALQSVDTDAATAAATNAPVEPLTLPAPAALPSPSMPAVTPNTVPTGPAIAGPSTTATASATVSIPGTAIAATSGTLTAAPTAAPATPVATISAEAMARAPRSDGLARDRYLATQAWLDTVPGSLYAAQLLTAADTDLSWVDTYLIRAARAIDPGQLHLYSVRLGGRQWYRVAYGQYGTAQEAAEAVARMPESLRQFRPYAETVDVMRRTNATAE